MSIFVAMLRKRYSTIWFSCCLLLIFLSSIAAAQEADTISNWDGIAGNWEAEPGTMETVENPYPGSSNPSARCLSVTTTAEPYDLILMDLPYTVNFDEYPKYSLLCFPPAEGGDVVMKFENDDVSDWQEIRRTAIGGQWNRLDFDFTGLPYPNYTRMVIFYDFLGTTSGTEWYLDEIIRYSAVPFEFESNLPIVSINTYGAYIPDDPKITAHMGIISNGEGNMNHTGDPFNHYDGFIGIEVRGQSSQMFPKKSYGVETRDSLGENLNVPLLGLPEENDWILYAPYTDKSLMRNVVTFEMGDKMGEYCTRNVYCELVINNDYKGIYVLQEKVKKDKNRVDIASLNPDEISGDDLTGGYIVSVDKIPWDFAYGHDGWLSAPEPSYPNAMDITFQYYYPEPDVIASEQRKYIRDFISQAEAALIAPTFRDPSKGYLRYLDAPSFIDFMLLCEISKEVDKYRYSTFFHKQNDSDGGKLFAGPAWDFDLGYGNVDYWPPGVAYSGWLYEMVNPWDYSIMYWWKRMMEDPYFRDLVKTRWTKLRLDKLSDFSLDALIDSITSLTEEARNRNYERWPILGVYVWPNYSWEGNDYEDEVEYFRDFMFNRIHWIDYNLQGQVIQPAAVIRNESNTIFCSILGDYFRLPILKTGNFGLNDAPFGIVIQEVEYNSPSECRLILSADVSPYPDISVTVDKKVLNTWEDLTSNKLASAGFLNDTRQPAIQVYASGGMIRLHCSDPALLPEEAEIIAVTGMKVLAAKLSPVSENVLPCPETPGVYLVNLSIQCIPRIFKVPVY